MNKSQILKLIDSAKKSWQDDDWRKAHHELMKVGMILSSWDDKTKETYSELMATVESELRMRKWVK